LMFMSKML